MVKDTPARRMMEGRSMTNETDTPVARGLNAEDRAWTPGPWKAVEWRVGQPNVWEIQYGTDGECVVEVAHGADNARLIAASPDMFEALEAVYKWAKDFGDSGDSGFWDFDDCPEGKLARKALDAALGGRT